MAKKKAEKPTTPAPLQPEILDADQGEQALITAESTGIVGVLSQMRAFFVRADVLEKRAKSSLSTAQTWRKPTNKDEDEALVTKVRALNDDERELEEHWKVTAAISRFHKRLTGIRGRAGDALEEAKRIGNRLHQDYKDEEARRVREEADRLRRQMEEEAQRARDRELAELEAAALKAEASSPDLSAREERFVDYYTGPYAASAARAAQQAGYKDPDQAAAKLLATPKIEAALKAKREALAIRDQAAARRAAPVEVRHVEVKTQVAKGGATTWSAELFDRDALLVAVLDPMTRTKLGIPVDILTIDQAMLNDYARSLHENIDRWPGVRHKKTGSIR